MFTGWLCSTGLILEPRLEGQWLTRHDFVMAEDKSYRRDKWEYVRPSRTHVQDSHVVTSTYIQSAKACHMAMPSEGALKYILHNWDLSKVCYVTAGCTTTEAQRSKTINSIYHSPWEMEQWGPVAMLSEGHGVCTEGQKCVWTSRHYSSRGILWDLGSLESLWFVYCKNSTEGKMKSDQSH